MKHHNFEFGLPLYPHQTIGEAQSPDLKLEMDGKELQGVTSLTARAGANGFTNVAIEFECSAAIKMAAAFLPSIEAHEEQVERLGAIYHEAMAEIKDQLDDGETLDDHYMAGEFVRQIITKALEQLT